MQMIAYKHATYEIARKHALNLAVEATRNGKRCVLLVRTFDDTVRVKKLLAERGCSLGVQVVALKEWLKDCWELFGDGRLRVDAVERDLMIRKVLLERAGECGDELDCGGLAYASSVGDGGALSCTPGIVALVGSIARDALPAALKADTSGFGHATRQVVEALRDYAALLGELGLIEDSQVAAYLQDHMVLPATTVVALAVETTAAQDSLLDSLDAVRVEVQFGQDAWGADLAEWEQDLLESGVDESGEPVASELCQLAAALFRPDFDNPVQAQGAVRFAFAAGPYAHDQLMVDQISSALESLGGNRVANIIYVVRNPYRLFREMAPRLADNGVSSSVRAFVPVRQTDFGRAWANLIGFVNTQGEPGTFSPAAVSDYALSSFSFMSVRSAQKIDERMRGWRGQNVDDALTDLCAFANEEHRDFIDAVARGEFVEAVNLQIAFMVTQLNWSESYRMLQVNAARGVREVLVRAQDFHLPLDQVQEQLLQISVPYNGLVEPGKTPLCAELTFMSLRQAAAEEQRSADILIVDDLTAQDYPLKDDRTATDEVMDLLGAFKPRLKIDRLRLDFQQVLRIPCRLALLARCLNDSDAKELRPAALLEELVDCYRRDPQNPKEIDEIMGLPAVLHPFAVSLGEDLLDCALDPRQPQAQAAGVWVDAYGGSLSDEDRARVLLPGRTPERLFEYPVVSPSAIESYMQCPYKWFVQSRMGAGNGIEAGFGALERGTYAHKILEMTHDALRIEGTPRVTSENVEYAKSLLGELFENQLQEELLSFESGAYVPLSQAEMLASEQLLRQLQAYLDWEADLLPDFAPWGAELSLGQDEPIEYAGLHVRGRLDRVDVDPYGRAVIVDYKGSVGNDYAFEDKVAEGCSCPTHIQTLVYAQLVRRKLGLTPVGAIYVSYGKRLGISGAYDSLVLHPDRDLRGISAEKCGVAGFEAVLDAVEEEIAVTLERMKSGDIEPQPCSAGVCKYCPALSCPKRGLVGGKE